MDTYNFDLNQVYFIKTDNEFISDDIIESNRDVLIINALSSKSNSLLLPKYIIKKRKELIKAGLSKYINVNDTYFLTFLINNEIQRFDIVIFGLMGLSYESVCFLKEHLHKVSQDKKKTFVLIDYNSSYKNTIIV